MNPELTLELPKFLVLFLKSRCYCRELSPEPGYMLMRLITGPARNDRLARTR
jgi:hypothetical protein